MTSFETTAHGKWILTGEHAVVRGYPAIVFPLLEKKLNFKFDEQEPGFTVSFDGEGASVIQPLFEQLLQYGARLLDLDYARFKGAFNLANTIPIGSGLGASAALCVSLSRWFYFKNYISNDDIESFATQLEHFFHGQSSGLDIAGAASSQGVLFQQGHIKKLECNIKPFCYLSHSGVHGVTSDCISQVQSLWDRNHHLAKKLDEQMALSVSLAQQALLNGALSQLSEAIQLGADCFVTWGLVGDELEHHMNVLKEQGAIAVKPTGSGSGGFVLSLWEEPQNEGMLIRVNF